MAAGEFFLRWGCGTLAQQTILHNKSNYQADLDPAPLPSFFCIRDCTELGSCPELITPESATVT